MLIEEEFKALCLKVEEVKVSKRSGETGFSLFPGALEPLDFLTL